jgi:signal transduction histidine kinase
VHNEGHRIPKSQLHHIFSPFKQLEPSTKPNPSRSIGLGLYIVQSIVTAHRGTIEVESTDAGTTFTMRLPRASSAISLPRPRVARHAAR